MADFRARIGRIKMKNGGADVHVLDRRPVNPEGEDWRGSIIASARRIGEYATPESPLAGYVVLGIYADGATSVGWRYDPKAAKLPRALLPHWVSEVIRRDLIAEKSARDVFDEMFQWVE